MKPPFHRLAAALVPLAAVATATPSPAGESADTMTLTAAGPGAVVRTHHLLPWRALAVGKQLRIGAELHCPAGCALSLHDGSTLSLEGGATAAMLDPTFVRTDPDRPAERVEGLSLRSGRLTVRVPSGAKRPVMVTGGTEEIVLVDTGRAEVLSHPDRLAAACHEGRVRTRASGHWISLAARTATTLTASAAPTPPRPLVTAPAWAATTDPDDIHAPIALALASPFAPAGGRFRTVDGVRWYVVQIARDAAFANVVQEVRVAGEASSFLSRPLAPGSYFARARAQDLDGFESAPSPTRSLRVVAARLPAGAVSGAGDRSLVLPEGRTIAFADPQGIEVAVDRGGFERLAAELGFQGDERRLVRMRIGGDPMSISWFAVERRALRADIELTPKLARWPDDPIHIVVRLADPTSRFDPSAVKPHLQVLVGLDAAPAEWTHNGPVWSTHLAPRPVTGPSVVRVIATDENGALLGRAFLEVDGPAPPQATQPGPGPRRGAVARN